MVFEHVSYSPKDETLFVWYRYRNAVFIELDIGTCVHEFKTDEETTLWARDLLEEYDYIGEL